MKTGILFFISLFFTFNNIFGQDIADIQTEPELLQTWTEFKKAVKNSDKSSLKNICTDSVKFSMQMGDLKLLASAADELPSANDKKVIIDFDNFFYLKFDEFYTYEMPQIFDDNVMARLDDESKMRIIRSNEPDADFKFFITVTDSDPEDGFVSGNEIVLRFKKTGGNFLFSGIDTIQ
ncbi:MAG: hypothetical protein L3J35_02425 [Bacteroidales bacterium]|nr:hypothetical protein [Bacteroidales bacterium]